MLQDQTPQSSTACTFNKDSEVVSDDTNPSPNPFSRMRTLSEPELPRTSFILPIVRKLCCFCRDIFPKKREVSTSGIIFKNQQQLTKFIHRIQTLESIPILKALLIPRKTLVLDLDETLVHTKFEPFPCDYSSTVSINGEEVRFYLKKRFGVEAFIAEAAKMFELVVYTAGILEYANKVLELIDLQRNVEHVLSRQHCVQVNRIFLKNLKILNRPLKNVILMDNSPNSGMLQPDNLLLTPNFYGERVDKELAKMITFLKHAHSLEDVRPVERQKQIFLNNLREKENHKLLSFFNKRVGPLAPLNASKGCDEQREMKVRASKLR